MNHYPKPYAQKQKKLKEWELLLMEVFQDMGVWLISYVRINLLEKELARLPAGLQAYSSS